VKINIVKPFLPGPDEIFQEVTEILTNGLVTNNSRYVRSFEEKLQDYFSSPIKPTVNCNGEMALFHLIQAWKHKLGYSPHDSFEVLVPSFTFSGTINALVTNNLKPVFCDVDDTLMLDLDKLQIDSSEIKMIVAVGAYGNLCDLDKLGKIAKENKLTVILDNAPAFGSRFKGKFPWEFGFSEMISFHATKIFNSMEGGANIVNDPEVAEYLLRLRDFGQYEKVRGDVDIPGLNSKMLEISALVGLKNLEKVNYILEQRFNNIQKYLGLFTKLQDRSLLKTMKVKEEVTCTYLYFPIILNEEASSFVQFMEKKHISVRRYYTATHDLKFYKNKYKEQDLSFTNQIKDRIVALPIHTIMDDEEINYLFSSVEEYFN
jgi:dTDP-4-amino-4,6-dideoxygalactose transaminase